MLSEAAVAERTESPSRSLCVLQLVTNLHLGGAEKLTTDLSIALHRRGHDVVVASWIDDRAASLRGRLEAGGVRLVPIAFPKPGVQSLARTIRDVRHAIRAIRPDIVHAHNPAAGTIALVARALSGRRGLPVVTTYHGVRPQRLRLAGRLLSGADAVIAVGPSAAGQLREGLPHNRVVEINNAVLVERTRSDAEVRAELGAGDGPLLAAVGRCVPEKGQELLVAALAELRCRGGAASDATLAIVGYGPLQDDLAGRAEELGVARHVRLTGARADAADIIGAADVLVHGSHREAMPLVVLEAMVLGVPVVAADAIGVRDVVRDRKTGMLVFDRDPVAFADAVEAVLVDRALRAHVVEAAGRLVEAEYPVSGMVDGHVRLYESLVADGPR